MQTITSRLRQSASVKAFTIGFLVLLFLIPLAMVRDTINNRDEISNSAKWDIQRTWGHAQTIAGPVLVLPYDVIRTNSKGERYKRRTEMYILPESLNIEATAESEIRYRGIHKVPVYSSSIRLQGRFADLDTEKLGIDDDSIHWSDISIVVGTSDGRAITETPEIEFKGRRHTFVPGGNVVDGLPPQIRAPLPATLGREQKTGLDFDTTLRLNGSAELSFLPFGDTTTVSVTSGWPSPSFSGNYLPQKREVTDDGFSAEWRVSSIGRALPPRWTRGNDIESSVYTSKFGVEFYSPISVYRLTLRAATYGVLFVALTFVSFFLFEVVAGLRLHPLQYIMIGFANVVFFLLLISLAEHIGFGLAYAASAIASSGLVIGYSYSVLGERSRAALVGVVIGLLYCFLYLTLQAETYALLAGSIGLWIALAVVMYLTRRIDWYERFATTEDEA